MMVSKENLFNFKFILLIVFLVIIDTLSKMTANNYLLYGQSSDTFLPIIDLLLIYNSGIAFGIFDKGRDMMSNLLLAITLIITTYIVKMVLEENIIRNKIALSFIAAGAIGNVIDRMNDGSVTDFLHLEILNFSFFIFNLADAFITFGAILIIYFELFKKRFNE